MKTAEAAAKKFMKLMGKNVPFIVYQFEAGHWGACSLDSENGKAIITSGGKQFDMDTEIVNHIVIE